MSESYYLGFDPGRDKCGLAIVTDTKRVLCHEVVLADQALAVINQWLGNYQIQALIIGNQTTSKIWQEKLKQGLSQAIEIRTVNERNSTLEARDRYWQMFPPQGLTKLLPQGLRQPPRAIDDIVAILLVERYFENI